MAEGSLQSDPYVHFEEAQPHSPTVDYGLRKDDGFDPSKYDFYNPSYRTASKAFIVRLGENKVLPYTKSSGTSSGTSSETSTNHFDLCDPITPPPLSPIEELDDDPATAKTRRNFDPVLSNSIEGEESKPDESVLSILEKGDAGVDPLEKICRLLFARQHLQLILADASLSSRFTNFLRTYRPDSVPILAYYLDAIKALKTIKYAEAIMKGLGPIPGHAFTAEANSATMSWVVEDKADRALDVLVADDLPAFIAYIYVRTVDVALVERVTGREEPESSRTADGLAEVFVLSDPSRPDNPIVFTSEEFHKMTGYPRPEVLGRNCRMLGGPTTSSFGINRFRMSLDAEREHCEVLLNYRKDGSLFVNLIMCVPLRDQSGKVRYYLGAQLDITDLVKDCTGLASLKKLIHRQNANQGLVNNSDIPSGSFREDDEFEQLSQTFNPQELEQLLALRQRQQLENEEKVYDEGLAYQHGIDDSFRTPLADLDNGFQINGGGSAPPLGYYKTYLLVRPHPSLRILFASPDLRTPRILQSPLMSHIGASNRVRDDLAHALEVGRKVTAKVQWLSKGSQKSRGRWIHCTPLLGVNDAVGVWMVILVDDDEEIAEEIEQQVAPSIIRDNSRLGSKYTAEAIPWESEDQKTTYGISTTIWSGSDNPNERLDESKKSALRRPLFRQPLDVDNSNSQVTIRPGNKVARRVCSITSDSDRDTPATDENSMGEDISRPTSSGSSNMVPIQSTMQPKVKFAGRPSLSLDREGRRKPPINMPYQSNEDEQEGLKGRMFTRRTYKSLSPYGILFED